LGNGSARPAGPALDRVEIVAVLHRYCVAVDERDEGVLRSCFAPEASASFNGHLVEGGPEAIAHFLLDSLANPTIDVHHVRSTQHHATTADVRVDGDTARSTSYAVVRLVDDRPMGARLVARGVSYRDRFVRTADGWRIEHREHRLDWMTTEALTP
jgi:hypothetical protein